MLYKRFFIGAFIGCISLTGFSITHSLFSDQATSASNTFTAASIFPTSAEVSGSSGATGSSGESSPSGPTGASGPTGSSSSTGSSGPTGPLGQLVINEAFEAGTNPEEWVEIYNPTAFAIDLTGWTIEDGINSDNLPSNTSIPAGGYAVIVTNATIVAVPGSALTLNLSNATIGGGLNGDGDVIILRNNSVIVDQMSYGNNISAFPSPPPAPSSSQSLARNPNGQDTDTTSDWTLDDSPTLGTENN